MTEFNVLEANMINFYILVALLLIAFTLLGILAKKHNK